MNNLPAEKNRRILVIDDNRAIHDDFRKILSPGTLAAATLDVSEAELFGKPANAVRQIRYEIDSAYQGQDGVLLAKKALEEGRPFAMAFVDTGTGMSAEVKARVFEPFFTTKGVGQGTGLGLSTCYGIIKQSGGNITVHSELARGTTFKIYLPQVEQRTTIPIQRLDSPDLPRGTETILLVEDDLALREMGRRC